MSKEIWKDIDGCEFRQVSNYGRIRNAQTGLMYKLQIDTSGYYSVGLRFSDGTTKTMRVHSIVANAFLGKCPKGYDVNHKDGDKLNNYADNLEYCSRSANVRHAYRTGLNTQVIPVRIVETGKEYDSLVDCARDINGDPELIRQCLSERYNRHTHKGYHFEAVDKSSTGRQALPVRIKETGEVFDSVRECARAVDGAHTLVLRSAHTGCSHKDLHFEFLDKQEVDEKIKRKPFLYDYQLEAINKLQNGNILCGSVGSGKSRSGLFYYFKENGGWIDEYGYKPMKNPQDLYIITTAKKRDSLEFEGELAHFLLSTKPKNNYYGNKIVIDSWNNLPKYTDVEGAFFLLDEQRLVSYGAWTKAFLKIAKSNNWILLTATPADSYQDFLPVFLANGFFKNKTEFNREHVIFSRYTKYPKIDGYVNTTRLDELRDKILVKMNYQHQINTHHEYLYCRYDIGKYKEAIRNRWDPYKNEPIEQASGLCFTLRRIVNSDESRQVKLLELLENVPKAIIFYNFNYERDILLNLAYQEGTEVAEWSGNAHQPIPKSERWVYLCQYVSACEGWENTQTDTIIFYSQNYSYKVMTQAAGRIDRLNTPFRDLYYYHLCSRSGIDLAISKALANKKKFNERRWTKWDK